MTGKVKYYNATKCFGFITVQEQVKDVYFSLRNWQADYRPVQGDEVIFSMGKTSKGAEAIDIKYSDTQ